MSQESVYPYGIYWLLSVPAQGDAEGKQEYLRNQLAANADAPCLNVRSVRPPQANVQKL